MTQPRLHLADRLEAASTIRLQADRAHYLTNVLRLRPGFPLRVFNAESGEWDAVLAALGKRDATIEVRALARPPAPEPGPVLHFAPFRRNRLDWMVEKAVELGVARLVPVLTERTVVKLDNPDRLRAIVVEAAEQCGRLSVPGLDAPVPFGAWLAGRGEGTPPLLFADEAGGGAPVAAALAEAGAGEGPDILVGPEGGFAPRERALLLGAPGVRPVSLGPRILRAETAALAALAAWQALRPQGPGGSGF
jgi:16S rRNA (uracil1498-N3)-methyltransferase